MGEDERVVSAPEERRTPFHIQSPHWDVSTIGATELKQKQVNPFVKKMLAMCVYHAGVT